MVCHESFELSSCGYLSQLTVYSPSPSRYSLHPFKEELAVRTSPVPRISVSCERIERKVPVIFIADALGRGKKTYQNSMRRRLAGLRPPSLRIRESNDLGVSHCCPFANGRSQKHREWPNDVSGQNHAAFPPWHQNLCTSPTPMPRLLVPGVTARPEYAVPESVYAA